MVDLSKALFLLIAPNSNEGIKFFEMIKQNKDKLDDKDKITDSDLETINSNKELITEYFIKSLKIEEREKIIRFLHKYKKDYDENSYNLAIKNLLSYKYNVLIRQSIKSMVKKMLKQLKDRLILELNDYSEYNTDKNQEFLKLIEGLYQ